jgi:hypothetical protein
LFHAGGRTVGPTNVTKLIVAFLNFANAPENGIRVTLKIAKNLREAVTSEPKHVELTLE